MKVIQVGIGGMGRVWLETVLAAAPEVEFAGFVEVNEATVDAQVERFGLDRGLMYRTLPEALAAVHTDAVIDVTPPQFHRQVSITALEAGLPVLSEKPLAPTPTEAQAIVETANRTGVLHMVAQNYRYSAAAQTLKQMLARRVLGAIGAVSVDFFKGPHFGGFREEMAYPLIVDMAIHHFDLLRYFLESDPVSVYGQSWNPAWSWFRGDASAAVTMMFANGVHASYNGSWCATGRETSWNGEWRFDCQRGVVQLIDDAVWLYPLDGEPQRVEQAALPLVTQARLLRDFYTAVTEGTTPATTCQDNIKSLNMVFNVVKSFETGAVISM